MPRIIDVMDLLPEGESSLFIRYAEGWPDARAPYLEWLDANDPGRAEILRLDAQLEGEMVPEDARVAVARLRELLDALTVDSGWWALVHRGPDLFACGEGNTHDSVMRVLDLCHRSWATLEPTDDPAVRSCDRCDELVTYCTSRHEAELAARQGACIAVPSSVANPVRRDLTRTMMGRPDWRQIWAARLF